jgi:hypothetical protein
VKEKRIELLRQGRVLPSTDLVGCHPASGERVPAPQPGETVVFYDHFPRGFALPASNFLRQFMDHFHLQLHHIGANAMMTLAAFATLCEAYLGIWPNVELFRRLIYFKTQTANPGGVRNSFLLCEQDYKLPWTERERVLQDVAALLLLCEESEGGG